MSSDTGVVENRCDGMACWNPPEPVCADDAAVTVYAPNGYCEQGECIYRAGEIDCDPGRCTGGQCETTPCQGVVCNHPDDAVCSEEGGVVMYAADGFCAGGDCYYASREVECDGSCKDGVCGHFTCHGVYCDKSEARYCKDEDTLEIFAPRGVCSSATGEAECSYAYKDIACENGCKDGACDENTCKGVACTVPDARYCEGDDLVVFDYRGRCVDGGCKYESHLEKCEFGCDGGECRENPCIGVTCMNPFAAYCEDETVLHYFLPDGVCDNGVCVYEGETLECENGCVDGACVGDSCAGVACNIPPATACTADSVLTFWNGKPGECIDGFCEYEMTSATCGDACEDGRCSDDFCVGVVCDLPGADFCLDEDTLYHYTADSGKCAAGVCGYAAETETCEGGCADGVCQPYVEPVECGEDTCNGRGLCDVSSGKISCECDPGWQGNRCETDIDECALSFDDCDENADCINTDGGYDCECKEGYEGDGTACDAIGEACSPDPCLNNGICLAADAGFACDCPAGFGGDLCEVEGLCIDADEDGFGENCENGVDCDDSDADLYDLVSAYVDVDLDGVGGATLSDVCIGEVLPVGYETVGTDCNDENGNVFQILTGYKDADGDGFGAGSLLSICSGDALSSAYSGKNSDCDDQAAAVHPDATEIVCNGVDDDCDAVTPDAPDLDEDGVSICEDDCDDQSAAVHPGATEILCNDVDDDCNIVTPDSVDGDGDGYSSCEDCNDSAASVNPGVAEVLCNGMDDDCSAESPDVVDGDGDGYSSCEDCDDESAAVYPGAPEMACNGVDDDCNADTPDSTDGDGDGFSSCQDCNDGDAAVNPGATEVPCNGVNDDCDAATPDSVDGDGDGFSSCEDCDDGSSAVNPAATEVPCNGVNDDCDAASPDSVDGDGDGFSSCEDCDDGSAAVNPGAAEVPCNGVNDDCNAATPDSVDWDGDGFSSCEDCDDASSAVNPGAAEVLCNGVDDDCSAGTPDSVDVDGDGYRSCDDCNDNNASINPARSEIQCNGVDDDCSATTSDAPDRDGDGFSVCTDCNDGNAAVNPGRTEIICNGINDDCNSGTSDLPEIDVDLYNCGGCGNNCRTVPSIWPQNAVPTNVADFDCLAGRCVIEECRDGFRNDPSNAYDDCDLDLSTVVAAVDIGSGTRTLNLDDGDTAQLTATCTSAVGNSWDCTDAVEWLNTDWNVADISQSGIVSPLIVGDAEIWALIDGISSDAIYISVVEYTGWSDRDGPDGTGDFELVSDIVPCGPGGTPVSIECRTTADILWTATGEVVTCTPTDGLRCINANQPVGGACSDYKVRFVCP